MKRLPVRFLRSCPGPSSLPDDGSPEVALVGRSNVGKSSLLNRLAGDGRVARTSSTPGCTRHLNLYRADERFYIVDLPGYGYARVPEKVRRSWGGWIDEYLSGRTALRGIVLLVDARHPGLETDAGMASLLRSMGKPYVIALTKSDKLGSGKLAAAVRAAGEMGPVIPVSATTGMGIADLGKWVLQAVAG
jgi:GTP-binding protein